MRRDMTSTWKIILLPADWSYSVGDSCLAWCSVANCEKLAWGELDKTKIKFMVSGANRSLSASNKVVYIDDSRPLSCKS